MTIQISMSYGVAHNINYVNLALFNRVNVCFVLFVKMLNWFNVLNGVPAVGADMRPAARPLGGDGTHYPW